MCLTGSVSFNPPTEFRGSTLMWVKLSKVLQLICDKVGLSPQTMAFLTPRAPHFYLLSVELKDINVDKV